MDDLFRWADKYVMLEDDVRAASQQVLVTNQPTKKKKQSWNIKVSKQPVQTKETKVGWMIVAAPKAHSTDRLL